jgi:hypothetical protein
MPAFFFPQEPSDVALSIFQLDFLVFFVCSLSSKFEPLSTVPVTYLTGFCVLKQLVIVVYALAL